MREFSSAERVYALQRSPVAALEARNPERVSYTELVEFDLSTAETELLGRFPTRSRQLLVGNDLVLLGSGITTLTRD